MLAARRKVLRSDRSPITDTRIELIPGKQLGAAALIFAKLAKQIRPMRGALLTLPGNWHCPRTSIAS